MISIGMRPTVGLINSYLAVVVHHRPSDGRMGGLVNRFWQFPYRVLPSAGDDNGGHDAESVLKALRNQAGECAFEHIDNVYHSLCALRSAVGEE